MIKKAKFLLYRLKWHLAPYINFSAPVHVDIELTSRCNLKCTFCHQQNHQYKLGYMEYVQAEELIKQCADIGVKSVKFNWRGESTQYPYFTKLLEYAQKLGLFTYVNTNLSTDYHSGVLRGLAKFTDILKVSIDSIYGGTYARIRKGARLTRTLKNLMRLAEYRKKNKMPPIIISRRTIGDMEPDRQFTNYFKRIAKEHSIKFKFDIRPAMPRNKSMKKQNERKRKYCGQPSRRLVIGWDGKAFPCCVAYDESIDLFIMGAKHFNIKEIWDMSKEVIPRDNKGLVKLETCRNCTSKDAYK